MNVQRNYLMIGKDNIGRDMMKRILIGVSMQIEIGMIEYEMEMVIGVGYGDI